MIPASWYYGLFLLLVTILTIGVYSTYRTKEGVYVFSSPQNEFLNWILIIFLILFIGLRPISGVYFVDMANYYANYYRYYYGSYFTFDWDAENLLFDNLFSLLGSYSFDFHVFSILMAVIYFGCAYLGIKRIFPGHALAAYLVFLGAFSTFSYGTNGLKAGAAASLFIWAMGYRNNLWICIPLALISWGFHHSMQLPVAAFVLTWFYKNPKWYYYGWVFCMLMAFLHIGAFASLFASFTDERGADYLMGSIDGSDGTKGGFRLDFILYSAMPILVGYILEMKRKMQVSDLYRNLIHLYIGINGIWMLCMYANFTNRIAYLSWFLYPVVLIYPFLYEDWGPNKYPMFGKVMLLHLSFTLFMTFIYY